MMFAVYHKYSIVQWGKDTYILSYYYYYLVITFFYHIRNNFVKVSPLEHDLHNFILLQKQKYTMLLEHHATFFTSFITYRSSLKKIRITFNS
jgi:hypothetical protein